MSADTGRSSRDVAHEAEDTRAHLASTLEQLRTNLRPENVVDEVMTNARMGAASIADDMLTVARRNPILSLLIGGGAALVLGLISRGRSGSDARSSDLDGPGAAWSRDTSSGRDLGAYVADRQADAAGGIATLQRHASSAYEASAAQARGVVANVTRYIPHDRNEARSKLSTLLDEQPLVLGAIGLAIGGAIGAALPITETEDHLMGGPSHQLKQAATDAARQEVRELRNVAGDVVENVRRSAVDHGLSADNLNDLVKDVGEHAKTAVGKIGSHQGQG